MTDDHEVTRLGMRALWDRARSKNRKYESPALTRERDADAVIRAVRREIEAQALEDAALDLYQARTDDQGNQRLTTMEHTADQVGVPAWLTLRAAALRKGTQ